MTSDFEILQEEEGVIIVYSWRRAVSSLTRF